MTTTAMTTKERPILMGGEMVRAILEGQKTQTRRVVLHKRQQPPVWATWVNHIKNFTMKHEFVNANIFKWSEEQTPGQPLKQLRRWPVGKIKVRRNYWPEMDYAIPCPYGVPGDRLWVRETWCEPINRSDLLTSSLSRKVNSVEYAADMEIERYPIGGNFTPRVDDFRWRPSIFLPRSLSRITLEILSVGVERVQEISNEDILNEGIPPDVTPKDKGMRWQFQQLWDTLNARRGYSWDTNPWVWVIAFKRLPESGK